MKIGIIATYKDMMEGVQKLQIPSDIELVVEEAVYSRAADKVESMEKLGVEAIISRGATCSYIEKRSSLPVINCDYGIVDVLEAVKKAEKLGECIGVLTYNSSQWMRSILQAYSGKRLLFGDGYRTIRENQEQVRRLRDAGAEVLVGGIPSVEAAKSCGMAGVQIEICEATITQAINEARKIVNAVRKEREELEKISQIIDKSNDAMILTDNAGDISIMNLMARQLVNSLFGINQLNSILELVPTLAFKEGVLRGIESKEEIRTVKNKVLLISQFPIVVDDERRGMVFTIQDANKLQAMEQILRRHLHDIPNGLKYNVNSFIGMSPGAVECRKKVENYAPSGATVIIFGETGTGKEILAQSIHACSKRNGGPFVAVNCSAIESSLLESELFGYSDGAFTGAKKGGKEGLFEIAHNGTIFLDEIGDISQEAQAALLRVIQEREIRRVGSGKTIPVDVRIIAATNRNLERMIDEGKFRLDLYYRLKILEIHVPPLRRRLEDIPLLVEHFCQQFHIDSSLFTPELLRKMQHYYWKGNVRELRNFVEKVSLLANEVPAEYLFSEYVNAAETWMPSIDAGRGDYLMVKKGTLQEMERDIFKSMYEEYGFNKSKLASALDVSRVTVDSKLKK